MGRWQREDLLARKRREKKRCQSCQRYALSRQEMAELYSKALPKGETDEDESDSSADEQAESAEVVETSCGLFAVLAIMAAEGDDYLRVSLALAGGATFLSLGWFVNHLEQKRRK